MAAVRIATNDYVLTFDDEDVEKVGLYAGTEESEASDGWAAHRFTGESELRLRFKQGKRARWEQKS